MAKKTIGIDCRLGGIAHAGIGRYIAELLPRITKSTHEISWVLFCYDDAQARELLTDKTDENIHVVYTPIKQYTLAEQLYLPKIFEEQKLDLLHVPHFNVPFLYSGPVLVTIHDLLWHEYRGSHVTTLNQGIYWFKYWGYRMVASNAIRIAKKIFVPAETVKTVVSKYYPAAEKKVLVTKEGIGEELLKLSKKLLNQKRKDKSLLYVGSLYPHKNITVVLQALETLPDYSLEIVGSRNIFQEKVRQEVRERGLENQVIFSGKLSDEELAVRYATTQVLVQPSFSEGFGLTGLEALAFNTPVLAADTPIFHEVYQSAASYFDPHSADDCKSVLLQMSESTTWRKLSLQADAVSRQYSWEKLAETTLQTYYDVLK